MKKNKFMRVAAVLLILCLATTCAISSTFAKYTTEKTAEDSARVAHWGWGATDFTVDLFDDAYNSNAIKSATADDDVVAPGATKDVSITIAKPAQPPEVKYDFDIAVATTPGTSTELLNKIVWTIGSTEYTTFAEFQTAIAAMSESDIAANALPTINSIDFTWEWAFEVDAAGNTSDTALGDASTAVLGLVFTFTATQVA